MNTAKKRRYLWLLACCSLARASVARSRCTSTLAATKSRLVPRWVAQSDNCKKEATVTSCWKRCRRCIISGSYVVEGVLCWVCTKNINVILKTFLPDHWHIHISQNSLWSDFWLKKIYANFQVFWKRSSVHLGKILIFLCRILSVANKRPFNQSKLFTLWHIIFAAIYCIVDTEAAYSKSAWALFQCLQLQLLKANPWCVYCYSYLKTQRLHSKQNEAFVCFLWEFSFTRLWRWMLSSRASSMLEALELTSHSRSVTISPHIGSNILPVSLPCRVNFYLWFSREL